MVGVAKSKVVLAKRVTRFLSRERSRDSRLHELLEVLGAEGEAYLFGGVLRDIALFGVDAFMSDLDVVFVGPDEQLMELERLGATKNRFGGFRIATDWWLVDLWEARQTWAFRSGVREYNGIESLLDTTITNWESVLYGLGGGRLVCREAYFEDLRRRYLDVVCEENPNALGMYVRLLKAYICKEASLLSVKAAETLAHGLEVYSLSDVNSYELEHYGRVFVSEADYAYLRGHADLREVGEGRVMLEAIQRPLGFDS